MSKRDLFSELTTALVDAKAHSQDKLTLRTHTVNDINDLAISPDEIVNIREISNIHQQERSKIGNKDAAHQMGKR
jgi:putative transcriptional regulator